MCPSTLLRGWTILYSTRFLLLKVEVISNILWLFLYALIEIIRVKHRVHVLWEKLSLSDPVIQGVVKIFFSPSRIMNNNGLIQCHTYGSTSFAFQVSHLWKWSTQLTCLKVRSKCTELPGWKPGTKPEDPVVGNWRRSSLAIDGCSLSLGCKSTPLRKS